MEKILQKVFIHTIGTSSLSVILSMISELCLLSNSQDAARIMSALFKGIDGVL